jgi:hypothetical protein
MTSMVATLLFPPESLLKLAPVEEPLKPRSGNPAPSHNKANIARTNKAIIRYKKAIGLVWIGTQTVAERLHMSRASAFKTLNKYHEAGILDRQPLDGKPYNKRRGYEWRVK